MVLVGRAEVDANADLLTSSGLIVRDSVEVGV